MEQICSEQGGAEEKRESLSFSMVSQSFCHIVDTEPLTHGPLEEGRDNAYTEGLLNNILSVFKHCKEILNAQVLNKLSVKHSCRKCRFPCHDLGMTVQESLLKKVETSGALIRWSEVQD